uniref:Uncharacterized protein n=1 Tax=biofilter metagenome TaxID=1070537 RepID=A0A193SBV7_9ZZZZ
MRRQFVHVLAHALAGLGGLWAAFGQVGFAPGREEHQGAPFAGALAERNLGPFERGQTQPFYLITHVETACRLGRVARRGGDRGRADFADALQGGMQLRVIQVPHMGDTPVPADQHMLRGDPQVERGGQAAIVNDDGHGQAQFLAVGADRVEVIAEAGVHGDDLDVVAQCLLNLFETGHLLPARDAPGCPELEVDRLLAIELRQVDVFAIDGGEACIRARLADQRGTRSLCAALALIDGGLFGVRAVGSRKQDQAGQPFDRVHERHWRHR